MMKRRHFLVAIGLTGLALPAYGQSDVRRGTFEGRSRHETSGQVAVAGRRISLGADFSLDRRVDPIVGLGRDGVWDPESYAGDLVNLTGAQDYMIPQSLDPEMYNEVYIWCRAADVPLGIARLE